MSLQNQVNFSTLSEAQRIELCQKYGINPDAPDAALQVNSIMAKAFKDKRAEQAQIDTNNAHSVFVQYQLANYQRRKDESAYADLTYAARRTGQSTETNPIKAARDKFELSQKSEQELDRQHDNLAARAMDSCFFAMG